MTTFVSQRLNILCIMFKIKAFFITTLLYVRSGVLFTCKKHFHDRITSLREEAWIHKTSFNPAIFIEYLYQSRKVSDLVLVC